MVITIFGEVLYWSIRLIAPSLNIVNFLDISLTALSLGDFTFTNWNLSAGRGGRYDRQSQQYGGGGGGILVNGISPATHHNQFQGEGYGGGGSGRPDIEMHQGMNGVILMEMF